jgi:pyridoxamine 5'-phosphate oxidase
MDLSKINKKIKNFKRENADYELCEESVKFDPFSQFMDWFEEVLDAEIIDPLAMILSTVDDRGYPDARVVWLKELEDKRFIFYTNYRSHKAKQLAYHPVVSLTFYWPDFSRQVRVRGKVEKVKREKSESYFATRPRKTQLGAHAWIQSSTVSGRQEMDHQLEKMTNQFSDAAIPCPEIWGGYAITPFEYEFFQARKWRMHDRLLYTLENEKWIMQRLAP